MSTHVYIIATERHDGGAVAPCKVGRSENPDKRLSTLQTASPAKLTVYQSYFFADSRLAVLAERRFHETQAHHRIRGEWYDMPPEIIEQILEGRS